MVCSGSYMLVVLQPVENIMLMILCIFTYALETISWGPEFFTFLEWGWTIAWGTAKIYIVTNLHQGYLML
jgi:hypothetical protein